MPRARAGPRSRASPPPRDRPRRRPGSRGATRRRPARAAAPSRPRLNGGSNQNRRSAGRSIRILMSQIRNWCWNTRPSKPRPISRRTRGAGAVGGDHPVGGEAIGARGRGDVSSTPSLVLEARHLLLPAHVDQAGLGGGLHAEMLDVVLLQVDEGGMRWPARAAGRTRRSAARRRTPCPSSRSRPCRAALARTPAGP